MGWSDFINKEREKDYFKKIISLVQEDAKSHTIYPEHKDIFNAFKYCSLSNTKVVILGQDPYINPGQAHGLSFSVPAGTVIPPSLKNIHKELKSDLNINAPNHGNLTGWAKQGVLLLNAILTVRKGESGSHKNFGWEEFTNSIISYINNLNHPVAFLLWGAFAKSKESLINNPEHLILTAAHPSPFSANSGFFGCKHFSQVNDWLIKNNLTSIDWEKFGE